MTGLAWWLLLFGMWPIGTLGGHDDLSAPMLAADLLLHAAAAAWLIWRLIDGRRDLDASPGSTRSRL